MPTGTLPTGSTGEDALSVIDRVKQRLAEAQSTLPDGVEIITVYDRSELIKRAIATLKNTLIEEMIIVSIEILDPSGGSN